MAVAAFRKIWDYLVGENEDELEDEEILDNAYDLSEEEETLELERAIESMIEWNGDFYKKVYKK